MDAYHNGQMSGWTAVASSSRQSDIRLLDRSFWRPYIISGILSGDYVLAKKSGYSLRDSVRGNFVRGLLSRVFCPTFNKSPCSKAPVQKPPVQKPLGQRPFATSSIGQNVIGMVYQRQVRHNVMYTVAMFYTHPELGDRRVQMHA